MQKCPNCSAPLMDLVEQCTHCGTITPRGVEARQARAAQTDADRRAAEQRSAMDTARARAAAQLDVDSAGKWAIISSLVGTVVCCFFPVGPVVGIIFGLRARRLATQHGLPGASLGTAGLTFGAIGLALSVMLWIAGGVMMVKENQHKAELKAQLGNVSAAQLDLQTACALTELELIDSHYEEYSSLDDLECTTTADIEQNGQEALLRDVHFLKGPKKVEVFACLRHRTKWTVHQVRGDEDCSAPKEGPDKKLKHE